jgi:hypothetical protein
MTNMGEVMLTSWSAELFQRLRSWSQLEDIRLFMMDGENFPLEGRGTNPFPFLRSLRFFFCRNYIPVLPTSPNTLHTLVIKFNRTVDFTYLRELISQHSISLRRLSVRPASIYPIPVMELVLLAGNLECLDVANISLEESSVLSSALVELHVQLSSGYPNVGKAVAALFVRCKKMAVFECRLVGSETPSMQDLDEAKLMADTRHAQFFCTSCHQEGGKVDWEIGEMWSGQTTWMH